MAAWLESLKEKHKDQILELRESAPGEPEIFVKAEGLLSLLSDLCQLEDGGFDHLADLSAYDEHPESPRFHVFYEIISMAQGKRMRVVSPVESFVDKKPVHPSVVSMWKGATWLERETYDMFGIHFEGHPDMRRILLPEAFKGYPLRKDFIVDYRQEFEKESLGEPVFDPFGHNVVEGSKTD